MEYIKSFDDLLNLKRTGEYELACDIDCEGKNIKCITGDFSGKIRGKGHRITNLILSDEIWGDEQTLALFYSMTKAEVTDITFENISVVYERACYQPRTAVLAGSCSNCVIRNVSAVMGKESENLALIYEANDCEIENVSIIKDGNKGPVVKYC